MTSVSKIETECQEVVGRNKILGKRVSSRTTVLIASNGETRRGDEVWCLRKVRNTCPVAAKCTGVAQVSEITHSEEPGPVRTTIKIDPEMYPF